MKAQTLLCPALSLLLAVMVTPVLAQPPADTAHTRTAAAIPAQTAAALTPTISITPLLLSSQQALGSMVTQTLIIGNLGTGVLEWQVVEALSTLKPDRWPSASIDLVRDGSFESGTSNAYWSEYSLRFGTPLCSLDTCFVAGARTGNWWSFFGGAPNNQAESGYLSQTITITPGIARLDFWMKLHSVTGTGHFTVTLDNTIIFTADQTMTPTYGTAYTQISRDVTVFADGQPHILKFAESDPATPGVFSLFVDDVSLTVFDCLPGNLPWLTVSPNSGTTAAVTSSTIELVFNSIGHAGTFSGSACLVSNDPLTPLVTVPVTLKSLGVFLPLVRR